MKKLLHIVIVFLLGFVVTGAKNEVFAANCVQFGINATGNVFTQQFQTGDPNNAINFNLTNVANNEYTIHMRGELNSGGISIVSNNVTGSNGQINFSSSDPQVFAPGKWTISLLGTGIGNWFNPWCELVTYEVIGAKCGQVSVYQARPGEGPACYGGSGGGCLDATNEIFVESQVLYGYNNENFLTTIIQDLQPGGSKQGRPDDGILTRSHGKLNPRTYKVVIRQDATLNTNPELCSIQFTVNINCENAQNSCENTAPIFATGPQTEDIEQFSLCKQIPENQLQQRAACQACTEGSPDQEGNEGVWTAIGCIKRDPQSIMQRFISVGLGMSGGVALLTFLAAGFIFSTSQGDPKAYGKAKEMMTAAIVGIVFVIFSVTILQFIGYNILKIPGFGGV